MARSRQTTVHIGVGGWSFAPWRGEFYPAGLVQARELEYASSKLTSIEINSTYYGSQKASSFAKWRAATPANFRFAVKGPRFATNRRVLAEAGESIQRFFTSGVLELQDKLGPVNWQLAPTKQFDADDIEAFFKLLPAKIGARRICHALEVRHPSFDDPKFIALARQYGVAIVLAGDSQYPCIAARSASFMYVRIMGTRAKPRSGYSGAALDAWADRIAAWAADPQLADIWVYVISGHKAHNPAAALALIERVGVVG
jgi:uncharacterized protein YecE (DUF72 family)